MKILVACEESQKVLIIFNPQSVENIPNGAGIQERDVVKKDQRHSRVLQKQWQKNLLKFKIYKMAQKFIIENGVFKFGNTESCGDLANNSDDVTGGGNWFVDHVNRKFYLHGSSTEFGGCEIEDLLSCIKAKKLPVSLRRFDFYFSRKDSIGDAKRDCVMIG